jgi:lysozyme family protein
MADPSMATARAAVRRVRDHADGSFDPEAVSTQCGAAVMLKALMARDVALS